MLLPHVTDVLAPIDLHPLLGTRRSSRLFDPAHTVSDAELTALLEAARWSPSAGNSQPWSFVVTRRGDLGHDAFVQRLAPGNALWAPSASALIVALCRVGDDENRNTYAAYDLGQSVAHLTVQAQALGLNVRQFAGFDKDGLAADLEVPAEWKVTTGVAVGRIHQSVPVDLDPALQERDAAPRERRRLDEFVFAGRFGQPHA